MNPIDDYGQWCIDKTQTTANIKAIYLKWNFPVNDRYDKLFMFQLEFFSSIASNQCYYVK